ncbi:hypothetical protein C8R45DRAFT_933614 [Mycena sanguinolenta]|nr:hypothetical protein C8R45DRAFT_933614 [Mycena sanguinolenta]
MAGYEKPRLPLSFTTCHSRQLVLILRIFLTLCLGLFFGNIFALFLHTTNAVELACCIIYFSGFFIILTSKLGQFCTPAPIKMGALFSTGHRVFHRSHISHMRIDRIRRLPGYTNPSTLLSELLCFRFFTWNWIHRMKSSFYIIDPIVFVHCLRIPAFSAWYNPNIGTDLQLNSGCESPLPIGCNIGSLPTITCSLALRLRGGCGSDVTNREAKRNTEAKRYRVPPLQVT